MKTYGKGCGRRRENTKAVRENWDSIKWGDGRKKRRAN
jgi:hypothetical protein